MKQITSFMSARKLQTLSINNNNNKYRNCQIVLLNLMNLF